MLRITGQWTWWKSRCNKLRRQGPCCIYIYKRQEVQGAVREECFRWGFACQWHYPPCNICSNKNIHMNMHEFSVLCYQFKIWTFFVFSWYRLWLILCPLGEWERVEWVHTMASSPLMLLHTKKLFFDAFTHHTRIQSKDWWRLSWLVASLA